LPIFSSADWGIIGGDWLTGGSAPRLTVARHSDNAKKLLQRADIISLRSLGEDKGEAIYENWPNIVNVS
jgi:hypothetical protein